jgi:isoleucyl-tRNA synthetase
MELAQSISSMVLSLRKKTNLRVRQPLQKIMIPISGQEQKTQLERVANLIKSEVNVKEMEYLLDSGGFLVRRIKANFKTLGPRYGRLMKEVAFAISNFDQQEINRIEKEGEYKLTLNGQPVELEIGDVEIITEDIPGWVVANQGNLTVALDITVTPVLYEEGLSRELVNRIQNLRKDKGFEVTDKITISVENSNSVTQAIRNNYDYICSETLAETLDFSSESTLNWDKVELTDQIQINLKISKVN